MRADVLLLFSDVHRKGRTIFISLISSLKHILLSIMCANCKFGLTVLQISVSVSVPFSFNGLKQAAACMQVRIQQVQKCFHAHIRAYQTFYKYFYQCEILEGRGRQDLRSEKLYRSLCITLRYVTSRHVFVS